MMKTIDIRVNEELIMKYYPCREGLDNFNKHYKDISIKEFINSEKISYDDKIWLLRIIVPKELMFLWAIDSSFAAYKNSVISSNYYTITAAANAAYYAANGAYYAANAADAANAAANAPYYAVNASREVIGGSVLNTIDAQKERLQALLYFIENEG